MGSSSVSSATSVSQCLFSRTEVGFVMSVDCALRLLLDLGFGFRVYLGQ